MVNNISMDKASLRCGASAQRCYVIALCLTVLVFVLAIYPLSLVTDVNQAFVNVENDKILSVAIQKFQHLRQCMLQETKRFRGSVWRRLHVIINSCSVNSAFNPIRLRYINFQVDKSFLPFRWNPNKECNVVTLGIGNELTYEPVLKEKYSHCQFYGADPYAETADVFKRVGQVFHTAIDNVTTSDKRLQVLKNGTYDWAGGVKVTSLGHFLKDLAKISFVHFLSMDVEGAEYRIMPYLIKGAGFDQESSNATICQISAEFHGPLQFYNVTDFEFEKMWTNFMTNSPFVPLKAYSPGYHHRFHLFNAESEYCINMFL